MAEKTQRELEFEHYGMGLDDLDKMIRKRMEHTSLPATAIIIDWLELAQSQLDAKYENINHIINRVKYVLESDLITDNTATKED